MLLSRTFQTGVALACVVVLTAIYFTTRGHVKLPDDDGNAALKPSAPESTATPTAAATPLAPTVDRLPLPTSKAEIIAALEARGYMLEREAEPPPQEGTDGYRVKGMPAAGVAFVERSGKLVIVDPMFQLTAVQANDRALDFAEIVGEVATGRSRETIRQAIAQTMNVIGAKPGQLSCSFGVEGKRFRVETIRHPERGYSFVFSAEPVTSQK